MYSSEDGYGCDDMSNKKSRTILEISPSSIKFSVGHVKQNDGFVKLKNGIYVSPLLYILFTNKSEQLLGSPFERLRSNTLKMIEKEIEIEKEKNNNSDMLNQMEYAEYLLENRMKVTPHYGRGKLMIF